MNEWKRRQWGPLEGWGSEAPDLVLVHGAASQATGYRRFVESLTVPAAALNLPGHGTSESTPVLADSIEKMAEAVESCLAALSRPVVLLGHSMGGAVVIELVLRKRIRSSATTEGGAGLRGIILYSTGAKLRVSPQFIDFLEHHYDIRTRDTVRPLFGAAVSDEVLDAYLALPAHPTNAQAMNDFRAVDRFDRMADIGAIDVPTLVIGGDSDSMTPPKYQAYLAEQIPGAERVILPGAGHMGHLENPAEMAAAVEQFMAHPQTDAA